MAGHSRQSKGMLTAAWVGFAWCGPALGGAVAAGEDLQSMSAGPVAWQAALDRAGFSPGIIDGIAGRKTRLGLRAFQARAGLPATAEPDRETLAALGIGSQPTLRVYLLTRKDAASVGPVPRDWIAKSRLGRLEYESLAALVSERGHCTQRLLAKLNPAINLDRLEPGDEIVLPNVTPPESVPQGAGLAVDFSAKVVRVFDKEGDPIGLFHCSIAALRTQRPGRACKVKTIVMDPSYFFDPADWPEVKGVDQRLLIPPGPRNPVGLCWIGLSLKGYGIHGSPAPELIGKTGSHGCIRLTNWDALRLAKMLHVGAEVRFTQAAEPVALQR